MAGPGNARHRRTRSRGVVRATRCRHRPGAGPGSGEPLAVRVHQGARARGGVLAIGSDPQAGAAQRHCPLRSSLGPPAQHRGRHPRAVCVEVLGSAGHDHQKGTAGRGLCGRRRGRTACCGRGTQEPGGSRVDDHRRQTLDAARSAGRCSPRGVGGRRALLVGVQAGQGSPGTHRRTAGRSGGAVSVGADRVCRNPAAGPGVDVPVLWGGPRPPSERGGRRPTTRWAGCGRPVPVREPTTAEVRSWALGAGLTVADRGRLRPEIWEAYRAASTLPDGESLP
ncbi:hypothetical protein BN381_810006 [Candidatus Microthrix parvicella RN1]|uniref:Lsr2 DNA-binding domain-containing protein n=1 Tax=Candidatus Neomicrothrix parvicella RN1 TaxID=1229780 RepID=R4Z5A4_9ACTN|nr:hypothetical protein BN381_810006 [Candidatus Microthrix parvicella RN1]